MAGPRNIYLTGFMACGKTTVGRILAARLGRRFVDSDALIEQRAGKKIDKIFKQRGEDFFRQLECQMVSELGRQSGLVVSLGGGAILASQNREVLRRGFWVFLDTPWALIQRRLAGGTGRPLAKKLVEAENLYKRRLPLYLLAPVRIDCGTQAPDAIGRRIAAAIP
jgi:shikimate kinase